MNCSHQRTQSRWVTTDYFGEETEGEWEQKLDKYYIQQRKKNGQ